MKVASWKLKLKCLLREWQKNINETSFVSEVIKHWALNIWFFNCSPLVSSLKTSCWFLLLSHADVTDTTGGMLHVHVLLYSSTKVLFIPDFPFNATLNLDMLTLTIYPPTKLYKSVYQVLNHGVPHLVMCPPYISTNCSLGIVLFSDFVLSPAQVTASSSTAKKQIK